MARSDQGDLFRVFRKSPDILAHVLSFTCESDQVYHIPSTNKGKAACAGGRGGESIARHYRAVRSKKPQVLAGDSNIQTARQDRCLGTLSILPNEIIMKILGGLEGNTIQQHYDRVQDFGLVCIALTSSDFYKICKAVHPAPLPTMRGDGLRDEKQKFWAWSLERHISDFLGPDFVVREPDPRYGFYTRIGSPFLLNGAGGDRAVKRKDFNDVF